MIWRLFQFEIITISSFKWLEMQGSLQCIVMFFINDCVVGIDH